MMRKEERASQTKTKQMHSETRRAQPHRFCWVPPLELSILPTWERVSPCNKIGKWYSAKDGHCALHSFLFIIQCKYYQQAGTILTLFHRNTGKFKGSSNLFNINRARKGELTATSLATSQHPAVPNGLAVNPTQTQVFKSLPSFLQCPPAMFLDNP